MYVCVWGGGGERESVCVRERGGEGREGEGRERVWGRKREIKREVLIWIILSKGCEDSSSSLSHRTSACYSGKENQDTRRPGQIKPSLNINLMYSGHPSVTGDAVCATAYKPRR
ncbi:hypothetical protein BsWGS_06676 [Bradybaena similaris]